MTADMSDEWEDKARELFCSLSHDSQKVAVGVLQLMLMEENHPF